jgi:outer membrane lipoprotein-sorting protein
MFRSVALVLVAVLLTGVRPAPAAATETARQILDRARELDETTRRWDDRHENMKFTIADGRGAERVRQLDIYERKYPGDERKSITFLTAPAEVKGTAFLAFTHRGKAADQWLYLPALRRVRQITASSRNENFVGSDLTYHDLDILAELPAWTERDARSALRRDEPIDGTLCHVVEFTPQRDDIGYTKIVSWFGQDDLVPHQLEFWRDGALSKRIRLSDISLVGAIPVAHRIVIDTPDKNTRTEVEISDVAINRGLEDDLFTQRRLERGTPD